MLFWTDFKAVGKMHTRFDVNISTPDSGDAFRFRKGAQRPRALWFSFAMALSCIGCVLCMIQAQAQDTMNCLQDQTCSQVSQQPVPTAMLPQPTSMTVLPTQEVHQQSVYSDSAGFDNRLRSFSDRGPQSFFPNDPVTDMQRLTRAATGQMLPIFGQDLFRRAPSTFAPADQVPSLPDYVVGPGDQLLVRLWGPESFNGHLTVDGDGSVYIPQVGAVHVAGLRVDQLQEKLSEDIRHTFKNFNLSVDLG
jgi:hypothetical protein